MLVALIAMVPLLLGSCAGANGGGAVLAKNQTFVWPYYVQAANPSISHDEVLDPAVFNLLEDTGTINMIYTNLVTFNSNLQVVPDATLGMPTVDPTHTIYTFHLRPNMRFNDGTPITASDFAYGIDRALDPHLCDTLDANSYYTAPGGAPGSGPCTLTASVYLNHILGAQAREAGTLASVVGQGTDPNKGVDVIDPLTLQIRLDSPVAFFLDALAYPDSAPMEKSFVTNPKWPGGLWVDHLNLGGSSGPFAIKSYGNGTLLTLVPNTYWEQAWGKPLTLTEVQRPVLSSPDTEYTNYRTGQYDFTDVPDNDYSFALGQADFHEVPSLATDYFGVNFRKAPFDNVLIRRAFDLALNKQVIVDRIENGGAIPTNHIVPLGMPGYFPGLLNPPPDNTQSITGNQPAAAQLIQQAQATCAHTAATGTPPDYCPYITGPSPKEIDITVSAQNSTRVQIAQAAADEWSAALAYSSGGATVPLNVQVKKIDGSTLVNNAYSVDPNNPTVSANPYQLWIIGWAADFPDPEDWLTLQFLSTNAPYNAESVSDPPLDALLKKADVEANPAKRMQEYNQAEQMVVNAAPWIPYQQDKWFWRVRTWVHGFSYNALGVMEEDNWANVYITSH